MVYLVTGGAGFIGSNLVKKLLNSQQDAKVRVLDNLSTGNLSKLAGYTDRLEFIEGDITAPQRDYFEGVDVIFHQAAISSVERSVKEPAETEYNNVVGTINVLQHAADAGVKRVVMAGSAAVYGDQETGDSQTADGSTETVDSQTKNDSTAPEINALKENLPAMPLSPYAFSKYAIEYYSKSFYSLHGLETVVLRYFNVFGPFQDPWSDYSGVISKFTEKMSGGEAPVVFGDGEQTRDFIFVEDVAAANMLAASSPRVGGGEVINIGRGESISILKLIDVLNTVLGKDLKPVFAEARKGDVRHSLANITRARQLLNFKPETGFAEGLHRTVQWLKDG